MFGLNSTTPSNTTFFGQSTPVNQNRAGTSLFGNTTTQPSTLTSTPFASSTNLFGGASPASTTFQTSSTGTGTVHKFNPTLSTEKINKNGSTVTVSTKLLNLCGMPIYEKKSMEELRLEDYVDNRKFPSTTSNTPLFGALPTATATSTANPASSSSLFGTPATTTPLLNSTLFGNKTSLTPVGTLPLSFGSTTTTAAAPASTTFAFGGGTTTTAATTSTPFTFGGGTTTTAATSTPFTFGGATTTTAATSTPFTFGGATTTTAATSTPFTFGGATTTTAATSTPFTFGAPTTSIGSTNPVFGGTAVSAAPATAATPFTFGSSQAPATSTASNFSFGGTSTLFPTPAAPVSSNASFGFFAPKTTAAPAFTFPSSSTTTTTAASSIFPTAQPATSSLFPTQNQAAVLPSSANPQSTVDTKIHLQLFQAMLNIQPFNNELGFFARNIKPNVGLDRTRLRTAPDSTNSHSVTNVFSPLLTKPSVLTTNPSTPPTAFNNQIPIHSHTLPPVLLPTLGTHSTTIGLLGKRKLADSFLDDDDDNSLMMDDGPSSSSTTIQKLAKTNLIKRPRVLDMNKIRSVVLGGGSNEVVLKEENLSDTYVVKSTSDNISGWKKYSTYDAYLASKNQQIENVKKIDNDKLKVPCKGNTFDQKQIVRLPKLTHADYYTEPSIDELVNYIDEQGQCFVPEFTVGRKHYGSVTFRGSKINLTGLDLDQLIEIGRRQVTVYPDDKKKPAIGEGLNCQAIISLVGVYPIDRSVSNGGEVTDPDRLKEMNYGNYLREMTQKFHGTFMGYDVSKGIWTFRVEHF